MVIPSGFPDLDPEALPRLPEAFATAERLAREWDLRIEGPLPGATCSLVLRMPLLEWERGASDLLHAFAPYGGVEVLREDPESGAVLLPRLRPGLPLDTLPEDEATGAWIALACRLRHAEGNAPSVETYLDSLWTRRTDLRLETDAPALARRLVETSPLPRLPPRRPAPLQRPAPRRRLGRHRPGGRLRRSRLRGRRLPPQPRARARP